MATEKGTPGRRRFSLPRFAINHPHITIVLSLLLVVLGVYSYLTIPVRMVPRIPTPNLGVVTLFPGMSAEDMERYITRPLEKRIQIVGGVNYLLGVSQEGYSKIVVDFGYDVNLQEKRSEMQALLDVVGNDVSLAIQESLVSTFGHAGWTPAPMLERLVAEGQLGRKTGAGFHTY